MKARWSLTPLAPTGPSVRRYFSAPTGIHCIENGQRRIAEFAFRNKLTRFVYQIDIQHKGSGQWHQAETSSHDNTRVREIIIGLTETAIQELMGDDTGR